MLKVSKIICVFFSVLIIILTGIVIFLQAKGVPSSAEYELLNDENEVNSIFGGGQSRDSEFKYSDYELKSNLQTFLYILLILTFIPFIVFLIISKKNTDDAEKSISYRPYLVLFLIASLGAILNGLFGGYN